MFHFIALAAPIVLPLASARSQAGELQQTGKPQMAAVGIFRFLIILLGLAVAFCLGAMLPEFGPGFFPQEGTSRGDLGSRCLALATLSGFVAGVLIFATGVCLLLPHRGRFSTGISLMMGAGAAALAMAACALVGGLLGQSRGGLLEANLIMVALPFAGMLFLQSVFGVWYLKRPAIRRSLTPADR